MEKGGSAYIITNNNRSTLYTGATSDPESRVMEHRLKEYPRSFSAKYNAIVLVYYENFDSIEEAIEREKPEMENDLFLALTRHGEIFTKTLLKNNSNHPPEISK